LETAQIGLHQVGPDGTILWANAAEMEMLGYRREEYIGHHIAEFHADETAINEVLGTLGRGNKLYEYEARLKCKDGTIKPVIIDSSVLWEEGRFIHTQCFTRDMTRRKQAEQELQEARRRSEQILERITDGFIAVDKEWRLTFINRYAAEVFGRLRPPHEFLCRQLWESFPGLAGTILEQECRRALAEQIATKFENYYAPLGGWFDVSVYPSREGLSIYFRDITERKRMEEALREGEERFRTLADNIAQFAWMADGQGSIFWYNKRWLEYTGLSLEEMQGWGWQKVHHPDHVGRVTEKIQHAFATGERWEDTFPLRGKEGRYRWFLSRAVPIVDEQGNVVRWLGTNTDITEQLQVEAALAAERDRSEHERRLYDTLLSSTPDQVCVFGLDRRFIYVNPALLKTLGRSRNEVIGKSCSEAGFEPQQAAKHDEEIGRVIATKQAVRGEVAYSGTEGIYDYLFVPVLGREGEVEAVAVPCGTLLTRSGSRKISSGWSPSGRRSCAKRSANWKEFPTASRMICGRHCAPFAAFRKSFSRRAAIISARWNASCCRRQSARPGAWTG
jgi:PAS domain S-box-containing protein